MGATTGIEWTDHTFNAWIGCTKVSPGCLNCYAKTRDDRHMLGPLSHWGPGSLRHVTSNSYWKEPLKWARTAMSEGRRHMVFTASQADIFDAEAPVEARRELWPLIAATCDWLDWQIVTKRPERIPTVMDEDFLGGDWFKTHGCWLLTSTENQKWADKRIPELRKVPAAVHGISAEPLLGPVRLDWTLDWVICGGESGPGARPMLPVWARSLRDQCQSAGVPFFMKQMGSVHGPKKGHELPEDLDIKQFPGGK